jgi:aldose 1-epimerase
MMGVNGRTFGKTEDGRTAHLYSLTNANGVEARITDYGGILVSLEVPDRYGSIGDVVLGYNALDEYIGDN